MPVPQLSIVIPSHNRPDLLRLCLASLQTHAPAGTQIIVVDDASRDRVVSRAAREYAGVEILRQHRVRGFAGAANRGIALAKANIVELLNDDTQVTAGWADAAMSCLADLEIAAVAPLVLQGSPSVNRMVIDSAGDEYDAGGFASKRGHGQPLSDSFQSPCEVFGASASSAFYRTEVLRAVGGFAEDFGAYFEDVDLSWRIRRAGYRTMFEPRSVVYHRVGSSHQRRRNVLERQSLNEERVFWRNVPDVRRALPRHTAVLIGKAVRRIREGKFIPWTFGRLRAWLEVPGTMANRSSNR
jgi:GT2 family glycosyltransferase